MAPYRPGAIRIQYGLPHVRETMKKTALTTIFQAGGLL